MSASSQGSLVSGLGRSAGAGAGSRSGRASAMMRGGDPTMAAGPVCSDLDSEPPKRWREVEVNFPERPGERSGAASVVHNNALYVFGGYGGSGRLDDLYKFDFETRGWHKVDAKNPPAGRENNGAVVWGGRMYLFGGYSGFNWLNDFHAFDFDTEEWTAVHTRGSPPSTRFGYVSAVSDAGIFYVFGGYDGCTWLNDIHECNLETGQWSLTNAQGLAPSGRSCPSWAPYRGSAYVFGGYDGVHRMQDFHGFDLTTRTWSPVRSSGQVPSARYFHASVVYGDSMFLFGGYSGHERLNDLYEFKFDTNTWFLLEVDHPPSGRSSLVAQVHRNSLYIFGGYNGTVVLNDFYEFRFDNVTVPPSTLNSDLQSLLTQPQYSDVSFLVEGREVRALRPLLAARSEHFRALFYGGLRESTQQGVGQPIEIKDIRHDVFSAMLEYLYTDRVPDSVSSELAVHLLIAAERFMLDRLKALCQDIIRRGISVHNVVAILLAANSHRADSLKDICLDYIISNEERLKQTGAIKELCAEPTLLYELLMRKPPTNRDRAGGFLR